MNNDHDKKEAAVDPIAWKLDHYLPTQSVSITTKGLSSIQWWRIAHNQLLTIMLVSLLRL